MSNIVQPSRLFRASEAASLGLHAVAALARGGSDRMTVRELAQELRASAAHLAKVLVSLEHAGIVSGTRGPAGGYQLTRPPDQVSVLEVYEALEGRLGSTGCPFAIPVCDGTRCVLGSFFNHLTQQAADKLRRTTVSDITLTPGA